MPQVPFDWRWIIQRGDCTLRPLWLRIDDDDDNDDHDDHDHDHDDEDDDDDDDDDELTRRTGRAVDRAEPASEQR